jgi:hypothetical protein
VQIEKQFREKKPQAAIVDLFSAGSTWWQRPAERRRFRLAFTPSEREEISRDITARHCCPAI